MNDTGSKRNLTVSLTAEAYEIIASEASRSGISRTAMTEIIVREFRGNRLRTNLMIDNLATLGAHRPR